MKPSIGRIVHFFDRNLAGQGYANGLGPWAAIITYVHPGDQFCDVAVFGPKEGGHVVLDVPHIEDGTTAPEPARLWWSWPPRVE